MGFNIKILKKLKIFFILSLILPVFFFLFIFDPLSSKVYPFCPFYKLTGLYCPGCGTARALHKLVHGHLLNALSMNPLMIISIPFLFYSLLSHIVFLVRGRSLPEIFTSPFWGWFLLVIVILFWILRNIPFYPFIYLAP